MSKTNVQLQQRVEDLEAELAVKNQMIELLSQQLMGHLNTSVHSTVDTEGLSYCKETMTIKGKAPVNLRRERNYTMPNSIVSCSLNNS